MIICCQQCCWRYNKIINPGSCLPVCHGLPGEHRSCSVPHPPLPPPPGSQTARHWPSGPVQRDPATQTTQVSGASVWFFLPRIQRWLYIVLSSVVTTPGLILFYVFDVDVIYIICLSPTVPPSGIENTLLLRYERGSRSSHPGDLPHHLTPPPTSQCQAHRLVPGDTAGEQKTEEDVQFEISEVLYQYFLCWLTDCDTTIICDLNCWWTIKPWITPWY